MNNITLLGNVVRDAEMKTFQQAGEEKKLAKFTLAVYRSKEKTDFIDVNAFDWAAESAEKFVRKGAKVAVVGALHQDNYTDKDGNPRTGYKVVANRLFATSKVEESTVAAAEKTEDDLIPFAHMQDDRGMIALIPGNSHLRF